MKNIIRRITRNLTCNNTFSNTNDSMCSNTSKRNRSSIATKLAIITFAGMMLLPGCGGGRISVDVNSKTPSSEAAKGNTSVADNEALGNTTAGDASLNGDISPVLTEDLMADVERLYDYQYNYSEGTALLLEIPYVMVENIYNNYDLLTENKIEKAPIMLREYACTNTVYLDYDSDYSIVWSKNDNSVTIEDTDIIAREDYKLKAHKLSVKAWNYFFE